MFLVVASADVATSSGNGGVRRSGDDGFAQVIGLGGARREDN